MSPSVEVLVLGAGGLLGAHVAQAFEEASFSRLQLHRGRRFASPDTLHGYLDAMKPAVVVNCIGYLGTDEAEHFRTNGCLPRAMADWCSGRALLIHISTNAVFPGDPARLWLPGDPIGPRTAYEISKAFGEDPRSYVVRVSFVGHGSRKRNLWDRLRAGEPYRDAAYNGVSAWELALHLVRLVRADARPRSGVEHVHSAAPMRISELARLLGSTSLCAGEADNARLLGGGTSLGPLDAQVARYLALEPRLRNAFAQPG